MVESINAVINVATSFKVDKFQDSLLSSTSGSQVGEQAGIRVQGLGTGGKW